MYVCKKKCNNVKSVQFHCVRNLDFYLSHQDALVSTSITVQLMQRKGKH